MSHTAKALLFGITALTTVISGCSGGSETTTTVTVTSTAPTTTAKPAVDYKEGTIPGGGMFVLCEDGRAGIATTVTSCEFAMNVGNEYRNRPRDVLRDVPSPVTHKDYDMDCTSGHLAETRDGEQHVVAHCTGGKNAEVVVLYQNP